MGLFRKRKGEEKMRYNAKNMQNLAAQVDVLLEMCTNEEIDAKLLKLKDDIAFSNPSEKDDVLKCEKKIENLLGDLKIKISAGKDSEKINGVIDEIKIALAERNSKL